jgi:acetyl-CoA acetyltransferase
MRLCLEAVVNACADAGLDCRDIDGVVSYGEDRNKGTRLMPGLGIRELKTSLLVWGGGGGGVAGALNAAATQIIAGQAECVVVFRSMAEQSNGRARVAVTGDHFGPQYLVNGISSPGQYIAFRGQQLLAEGVPATAMKALVMADYYHASRNPRALGYAENLDDEKYDSARWITEPFRLYDSSRESDGACAVILVSAERARTLAKKPAYLLSAPVRVGETFGDVEENHSRGAGRDPKDASAWNFHRVAPALWRESGYQPADVNVAQVYEHFSMGGVASLIYHGFCTRENVAEFMTFENLIAPDGKLPVNTSGGNGGEAFIHGMNLVLEAVRQIRGDSYNQVPCASLSFMSSGPSASLSSSLLFGSEETL